MSDSKNDWWRAHAEATETIANLPGVRGIGLGIKETARELTGEVAVIVYVDVKRPSEGLDPAERIPPAVAGVKTDVQRALKIATFGGTTIEGGIQIRATPDDRDRPKPGTLGYIATRESDSANVMLSCQHVMRSRGGDNRIFHPDVSRCCGKLKNRVGEVGEGTIGHVSFTNSVDTSMYFVDAAIASIDAGINARKFISGVGAISGSGDLTATPIGGGSSTISVKKRGAKTELTGGTVDDVAYPFVQVPGAPTAQRVIRIRPASGNTFPFSITWQVPPGDVAGHVANFPTESLGGTATQVDSDRIRFDVPVFAVPGDSGSAVVDTSSGRIVGLVFSGSVYVLPAFQDGRLGTGIVPTGFAVACHIPPVLAELGIRIDASTTPSAGRRRLLPGTEISADPPDRLELINARLGALESSLDAIPAGRRLTNLLREHVEELVDLVHHRRRVLVEWHRTRGPAFSALTLEAIADGRREMPEVVSGVSRDEMLRRMRDVLAVEGSAALKEALAENESFLLGLLAASRTVDDLVANLK